MCSARMVVGTGAPYRASACCGDVTMEVWTVSNRWWVSCGGTIDQDPIPQTPIALRPSSTGSTTALDSMSNFSRVAGNSFWKAATADVNGASGNITSTATLSSG